MTTPTIEHVSRTLTAIEAAAHRRQWAGQPEMLLLHPRGNAPTIPASMWHHGPFHSVYAVAEALLNPADPFGAIVLKKYQHDAPACWGIALLYEEGAGDQAHRFVRAVDAAGREYEITRRRGYAPVEMIRVPPQHRCTLVQHALIEILRAVRGLPPSGDVLSRKGFAGMVDGSSPVEENHA